MVLNPESHPYIEGYGDVFIAITVVVPANGIVRMREQFFHGQEVL